MDSHPGCLVLREVIGEQIGLSRDAGPNEAAGNRDLCGFAHGGLRPQQARFVGRTARGESRHSCEWVHADQRHPILSAPSDGVQTDVSRLSLYEDALHAVMRP
ncbi:MAG TPA: hypothetical protein VH092_31555, partial [Urbifossiella sp.]|nr:hypothetical protein [Urbifossiella sp.]